MPLTAPPPVFEFREQSLRIGPWRLSLSFWPLQTSGWLLYGLVPLVLWLTDLYQNAEALWFAMMRPFVGFLTTTAIRPFCRVFAARRLEPLSFILGTSAAAFLLAALDYALTVWIGLLTGHIRMLAWDLNLSAGLILFRWISIAVWILLYFSIKQSQRSAALDRSNREAELSLLRAQVHPHFLFNALNTIQAEARDAEKVRQLTLALADYLRFSLKQDALLQFFGDEICALENYLYVQKARFEERLEYAIDVPSEVTACQVPPAIAQPLLENALKFGQLTSPDTLKLKITARLEGKERLLLTVTNSGSWVEPGSSSSPSTGLANLRRRLELIYGNEAWLTTGTTEAGVLAQVSIPLRNVS